MISYNEWEYYVMNSIRYRKEIQHAIEFEAITVQKIFYNNAVYYENDGEFS